RNAARGRLLPGTRRTQPVELTRRPAAPAAAAGCWSPDRPYGRYAAQARDRLPHQRAGWPGIQEGVRLETRPGDREGHGTGLRRLGPQVLLRRAQLRFI